MKEQPKKDLAYYLTLFKIEGHETWRADIKDEKDKFEKLMPKNFPKITEKNVIRIDRITGTIMPIEND